MDIEENPKVYNSDELETSSSVNSEVMGIIILHIFP